MMDGKNTDGVTVEFWDAAHAMECDGWAVFGCFTLE